MVTIADHLFRNNLNSRLYSRPKNWSGVEWSGVEWSGVEWSGVEWSGVEWSGVERSGVEWSGVKITMFSTIEPCKSLDSTPFDPDPDSIFEYMVTISDHLFRNSWTQVYIVGLNYLKITMFSTIEPCKSLDSMPLDQWEGRICLINANYYANLLHTAPYKYHQKGTSYTTYL